KGAFPAFQAEPYLSSGFMKQMCGVYPEVEEAIQAKGMRNVTVITQAPTGSTGTMVGTSTGIEPYFAFKYYRQSRLGYDEQFVPIAQQWKDAHPNDQLPDYFVTAMDLSAEDHIRAQAAIQRWVDSSISKTANCPNDFTVEQTKELYELAFDLGCKGVTIYRDGSRDVQVLSTEKESKQEESNHSESGQADSHSNSQQKQSEQDDSHANNQEEPQSTQGGVLHCESSFVSEGQQKTKNNGDGNEQQLHRQDTGSSGASSSSVFSDRDQKDGARAQESNDGQESTNGNASPSAEVTATKGEESESASSNNVYKRRPQVLRGATYKINTPFGMAYITINDLNDIPAEIFLNVGKAGSDVFAMAEALGRVCSLFLRYGDHGNKVELLIKHLKGIGGSGSVGFGANRVESIADAVAKALETHMQEQACDQERQRNGEGRNGQLNHQNDTGQSHNNNNQQLIENGHQSNSNNHTASGNHQQVNSSRQESIKQAPIVAAIEDSSSAQKDTSPPMMSGMSRDLCPSCGSASLINMEGCKTCANCGYSRCS
ncbi:hypothetical protein AZ66_18190, partial [Paenibacillus sp. E194]|uniref:TSCPD domain-containing protein n=1 Tax=Paenibacillus sp. E194 TaxID=1458845 RepID=UPI0005C876A3